MTSSATKAQPDSIFTNQISTPLSTIDHPPSSGRTPNDFPSLHVCVTVCEDEGNVIISEENKQQDFLQLSTNLTKRDGASLMTGETTGNHANQSLWFTETKDQTLHAPIEGNEQYEREILRILNERLFFTERIKIIGDKTSKRQSDSTFSFSQDTQKRLPLLTDHMDVRDTMSCSSELLNINNLLEKDYVNLKSKQKHINGMQQKIAATMTRNSILESDAKTNRKLVNRVTTEKKLISNQLEQLEAKFAKVSKSSINKSSLLNQKTTQIANLEKQLKQLMNKHKSEVGKVVQKESNIEARHDGLKKPDKKAEKLTSLPDNKINDMDGSIVKDAIKFDKFQKISNSEIEISLLSSKETSQEIIESHLEDEETNSDVIKNEMTQQITEVECKMSEIEIKHKDDSVEVIYKKDTSILPCDELLLELENVKEKLDIQISEVHKRNLTINQLEEEYSRAVLDSSAIERNLDTKCTEALAEIDLLLSGHEDLTSEIITFKEITESQKIELEERKNIISTLEDEEAKFDVIKTAMTQQITQLECQMSKVEKIHKADIDKARQKFDEMKTNLALERNETAVERDALASRCTEILLVLENMHEKFDIQVSEVEKSKLSVTKSEIEYGKAVEDCNRIDAKCTGTLAENDLLVSRHEGLKAQLIKIMESQTKQLDKRKIIEESKSDAIKNKMTQQFTEFQGQMSKVEVMHNPDIDKARQKLDTCKSNLDIECKETAAEKDTSALRCTEILLHLENMQEKLDIQVAEVGNDNYWLPELENEYEKAVDDCNRIDTKCTGTLAESDLLLSKHEDLLAQLIQIIVSQKIELDKRIIVEESKFDVITSGMVQQFTEFQGQMSKVEVMHAHGIDKARQELDTMKTNLTLECKEAPAEKEDTSASRCTESLLELEYLQEKLDIQISEVENRDYRLTELENEYEKAVEDYDRIGATYKETLAERDSISLKCMDLESEVITFKEITESQKIELEKRKDIIEYSQNEKNEFDVLKAAMIQQITELECQMSKVEVMRKADTDKARQELDEMKSNHDALCKETTAERDALVSRSIELSLELENLQEKLDIRVSEVEKIDLAITKSEIECETEVEGYNRIDAKCTGTLAERDLLLSKHEDFKSQLIEIIPHKFLFDLFF